jgi:hypothetical protein
LVEVAVVAALKARLTDLHIAAQKSVAAGRHRAGV